MLKVGDKIWVNTDGPAYLWPRSDLVVYELLQDGRVKIGREKDKGKSVKHICRLRPEQINKQKSPD